MTAQEKENQNNATDEKNNISGHQSAPENLTSEINELKWSVITFETRAAGNLTYEQAVKKLNALAAEKVAGLCIITDEAAERIKN